MDKNRKWSGRISRHETNQLTNRVVMRVVRCALGAGTDYTHEKKVDARLARGGGRGGGGMRCS